MLKQTQELTWSCSDIFLNWNWTTLSGISSSLRTTLKGWKWVTLFYIYALYWLYEQRGSVSLRLQFWMFSDESVGSAMNCDLWDEANPKLIYLLVQIFYNQLFSKPIFSEYSRQWIFISWSSLMVSLFTAENSVSQRGEPHFPLGWWEEHLRKVWGFRKSFILQVSTGSISSQNISLVPADLIIWSIYESRFSHQHAKTITQIEN